MLEGILEGQMNPHFSPLYTLKHLMDQRFDDLITMLAERQRATDRLIDERKSE